ncbi:MAG: class I SAM-dependent methyltransferase, partial [Flavobacteriales bacterium]|nr:class I SAM-dependent methyltransferase [Flavobacteriales bacterium]
KTEGAIGIDFLDLPGVDHIADIEKGLPFLEDRSVDEIRSNHVFEHLDNFEQLMKEIHRVLKNDGIHRITVPHFSNPYYYSDYTHKRFFGLYTFDYFATPETMLKRKVPPFYNQFKFDIVSRRLRFKSTKTIRYLFFKKLCNFIFNLNPYWQELYEELFTGIFGCFEITFVMKPRR